MKDFLPKMKDMLYKNTWYVILIQSERISMKFYNVTVSLFDAT